MIDTLINILAGVGVGIVLPSILSIVRKYISKLEFNASISVKGIGIELDLTNPEKATQEIISISEKPQVFFAYSFKDKSFVDRLAKELQNEGLRVWLAEQELRPGDDWKNRIREGLQTSGYMIAIISKSSVESKFTRDELNMALDREQKGKWPRVIPVLIDDVRVPENIENKLFIDFRHDYKVGIARILKAIYPPETELNQKPN